MSAHPIFSKPVWQHFMHHEGVHELPLPALVAADQLLDELTRTKTVAPTSSDYAMWAQGAAAEDPGGWLDRLGIAAAVILPSETAKIAGARALLRPGSPRPEPALRTDTAEPDAPWDPCERLVAPRARKVSVHPWELPDPWQAALRRAAQGLPGKMTAAPARDILLRTREKLCQLAWSARQAGLAPDLTEAVVRQYLEDLETRLRARTLGIRWATLRATVEELYRFARYTGITSQDDRRYLMKRLSRYEFFEQGQDALKFSALLETGNTTLSVLDQADEILEQAAREKDLGTRHRLRNAGTILGLYSIVPLRNADAELILGETLLWESGTWVIDTPIRKTMAHSPEHLVVPLEPEFCRYVDAVVLGDFEPEHLPELRARAARSGRPLIVHPDGSRPSPTYIPRIFKERTGNSFTTTRTMLHTDQAISRGEVGTRDAMVMAHQTSPRTAQKYQEKRIRRVAINRVQDAAAARRAGLATPDLLAALRELNTEQEEQE
ncbi:hypothetical protein AAFO90_19680 [Phaeobacter sp. CAU 1743]|uniref:hypothetical protein n=1 Tax=Phaeobacter sp. CAU 1743 TaxID=3140367 RepID=UPI00325B21A5